MISPALLAAVGAAGAGMTAAGLWLAQGAARQARLAERIASVRRESGAAAEQAARGGGLLGAVAGMGAFLSRSGLLPASTLAALEATLSASGVRQSNALRLFVGAKLVLFPLLPLLAWLGLDAAGAGGALRPALIGAAGLAGLLLPDMAVRRKRAAYLKAVNRGLPDALDMLVICSEAGLGLEVGLERVAAEIAPAHPAIAAELRSTSAELRVLSDRRTALANMGTRTGLETLRRLGSTLIQTLQYGTPLSQALRTLAAEMRYETLMRFEAQAARLPVLLTLPMILFILPCIFIVVGGPAGLTVMRTFIHK